MRMMKAAVMEALGRIEIEEKPVPEPKKGQVLVRVKHVGICGSDLHYYEHGRIGDYVVEYPFILGHECGGIVEALGEGVSGLCVGDKVALEPGITCGQCEFCKEGKYNLCPNVEFFATPPYDGTFCEYVCHPANMCFKLPENMDTLEGALIEPLAVGMQAVYQSGAKIGQSAVILGSGCIGLCTLLTLKAMGVYPIYIADVLENRLDMARRLGASEAVNAKEKDIVEFVREKTGGRGVDLVFETAGSKVTTMQTASLVRRGGEITLVGLAPDSVLPYDIGTIMNKEATIHTVFRYRNLYPKAIAAVASGAIPIKDMVTNLFQFQDTDAAMRFNSEHKAEVVKAAIVL